jgi:hypothetical protein
MVHAVVRLYTVSVGVNKETDDKVHVTPCVVVRLYTRVTVSVGVNSEVDDTIHATPCVVVRLYTRVTV